jgi:hypothetical protein
MMLGAFENQLKAYHAVVKAVENGRIPMEYIDKSVKRILDLKNRFVTENKTGEELSPSRRSEIIRDITKRSVTVLRGEELLPLSLDGKKVLVLSPDKLFRTALDEHDVSSSVFPWIERVSGMAERFVYSSDNPSESVSEIIQQEKWDVVIAEIFARSVLSPELEDAWRGILTKIQSSGGIAVTIPLLSPYGMPDNSDVMLTGYNYSSLSMEMVAGKITIIFDLTIV